MIQANVHEAKTRLSQLIARAEAGEEVVIARGGRPVVRLTPLRDVAASIPAVFGSLRDKIARVGDAAAADAAAAALFEGGLSRDDRRPLELVDV